MTLNSNPSPCSSLKVIPYRLQESLDFWYIAHHDRRKLIECTMPYMAARLPERYLLRRFLERNKWANDILGPTRTKGIDTGPLQQITALFWADPRRTIAKLVALTRVWFFTLLRHTYRMHFFHGSKMHQSAIEIQDLGSFDAPEYTSGLTESEIHRLICIPNKYGATFYRKSYSFVKRCSAWERLCAEIQTFCNSVGLFESPEDPEQSLEELRNNLGTIVLQQGWLQATARLDKTDFLVRDTAERVKKIDKRAASEFPILFTQIEETRRQMGDIQLQCVSLTSAEAALRHSQRCDSRVSAELQKQREAWEKQFNRLHSKIEESEARSKHLIMLAKKGESKRTNSTRMDMPNIDLSKVEVLVACRWLLEHLPAASSIQQGFGNRWRQFWQTQLDRYKEGPSQGNHPLSKLYGNKKYERIGKSLYSTLSNFLHEYGVLRTNPLDIDVQTVVDTIKPVHYNNHGKIDIEAERRRWLIQV